MKSLRYLVCGAALFASIGVSSASAANWDPVGTEVTATGVGSSSLTAGAAVTCSSIDARLAVTAGQPDLATTTHGIHNPVAFTNCTSFAGPATVTTFGTWEFTAINTTTVTGAATPATAGGPVAQITFHNLPACTISIGGADIPNNTWSNATRNLTINNAAVFPVTSTAGCLGVVQNTGTLDGVFNLPVGSQIT